MAVAKYNCKACHKNITASGVPQLRYRKHDRAKGEECPNSRTIVPNFIVQRGPEQEDTDVPVIGRDYAPCPECGRSPLLDDEGRYADHIKEPGVPSAERVQCPKGGQPYAPEGEECTTSSPVDPAPSASAADSGTTADTASPASEHPSPKAAPATAAPPKTPVTDGSATTPSSPRTTDAPTEAPIRVTKLATYRPMSDQEIEDKTDAAALLDAEGLLSKWATKVREIEDRSLPETDPSPASTPTQSSLPPRPDAPEAPPPATVSEAAAVPAEARRETATSAAHAAGAEAASTSTVPTGGPPSESATTGGSPAPVPTTDATAAPTSPTKSNATGTETPPDILALAKLFPRSARTPGGTAASAGPTPAAVLGMGKGTTNSAYGIEQRGNPAADTARTRARAVEPSTAATLPTPVDAPPSSSPFAQPGSPFSQPAKLPAAVTDPIPMTVLGEQVAARMKELFYSYDNRKTDDNRSAQVTLGPSEIGTPCDRRLAMSLLGIPAVNPGGDGWAAFVGTCIHAGLADMFTWADAGTGRFAVEQQLTFPNEHVPRGTADLLDRTLCMVDDHKAQGRWSLDKLKTQGIPPGYRVQLHTYGYGKRLQGEVVDFVALISWPREASTLADLYVVVEPYDPQVARDALERVDRIAELTTALDRGEPLKTAREFDIDPESCKFCPHFAPGDADMTRGCNGRA